METETTAKSCDAVVYPIVEEFRTKSTEDLELILSACDHAIELGFLESAYFAERGIVAYVLAERKKT